MAFSEITPVAHSDKINDVKAPDCYPLTLLRHSAFIIAVAVSCIFQSCLTLPLICIAATQLITIVAVKIYTCYNPENAKELQLNALKMQNEFPLGQLIAFVVTIAVSFVFPILGCITGALLGLYAGFLTTINYYKRIQHEPEYQKKSLRRRDSVAHS